MARRAGPQSARVAARAAPSVPLPTPSTLHADLASPFSLSTGPQAERQIAILARVSRVDGEPIEAWLAGMPTQAHGTADRLELARCKQLVLASCLNAVLQAPGGRDTVPSMLARDSRREQRGIVQHLLQQLPIQTNWARSQQWIAEQVSARQEGGV